MHISLRRNIYPLIYAHFLTQTHLLPPICTFPHVNTFSPPICTFPHVDTFTFSFMHISTHRHIYSHQYAHLLTYTHLPPPICTFPYVYTLPPPICTFLYVDTFTPSYMHNSLRRHIYRLLYAHFLK